MSEFLDKNGPVLFHQLFKEYIDGKIPDVTTDDNGKILSVENGVPTWISVVNTEGVKY